ncbi:MAG: hypothetical protein H0T83_08925 [Chthoniobacterales bacterium]|nr:hypothetical protein [Chthoniobacterales bacterium]
MKRFLLLLVLGAVAAFGIWYGLRGGRLPGSASTTVISLLPKETLALVHVPDFNGTRAKWHETDIYKLWREPAVQDFLQRPLSKMPNAGMAQRKLEEFDALEIKDAFLAITSWENNQAKLLSGFRFKGSADDAEKVIGQWRTQLPQNFPNARREAITHEQHRLEVVTAGAITIATVYDGQWFFAANDVAALRTLLDRADGRLKDQASTLGANESFTASLKRVPGNYAVLVHGRLDQYFEKISRQNPASPAVDEQVRVLRQIKSITAASRIENGKFRDVLFVAMPQGEDAGDLTRASLSLATTDSFLYLAGFLKLPSQMLVPGAEPVSASTFAGSLQRMAVALSAAGVTLQDWRDAFGPEFGIVGDWMENSRWPSLASILPVKDAARARAILATISNATAEGEEWARSEKEGVQYFSKPPLSPMVPIAPTIALSDQLLVLGQDPGSAEGFVKRSRSGSSDLTRSAGFRAAERLVGEPEHAFAYVDTALLYRRLDSAVRPMLVMAAAFMPGIAATVELGKLPAADVVAKHLSPMVLSQRYETDGYLTESVGPVSIYQAAFAIAGATGAGTTLYHSRIQSATATPGSPTAPSTSPAPPSSASPEQTP